MDDLSIDGAEQINVKEMFSRPSKIYVPKVDMLVSKIVGKTIMTEDPRLIRLIVSWKKNKPQNSLEPDRFMENPKFIEELKKVLV
jgi:hypothetical protein